MTIIIQLHTLYVTLVYTCFIWPSITYIILYIIYISDTHDTYRVYNCFNYHELFKIIIKLLLCVVIFTLSHDRFQHKQSHYLKHVYIS